MNQSARRLAAVSLLLASAAWAQPWPNKPLTILNGFPAGGNPDTALRHIASRLEVRLGQPVVVESRPGAAGTIAAAAAARAAPDGYTLLFGVAANLAAGPAAMKSPPYDPLSAFAPIIEVARGPYVWVVSADSPAKSFPEYIAWAKGQPGKLNYGSPGQGSVHHFTTEMVARATGLQIVHIPYRGAPYASLLSGEVQSMLETMPGPLALLQSGKLRALALTGTTRLPGLPEVPTFAELGVPGIDSNFWWGIVGPSGLPRPIVERLNGEIRQILAEPAMQAIFRGWQIEPTPGSPEAFGAYIASEYRRWKEIVAKSGLPLD